MSKNSYDSRPHAPRFAMTADPANYLGPCPIVDCDHPEMVGMAQELAGGETDKAVIAERCFRWVRDQIQHSSDFQRNPVTCVASAVLEHRTGYCYAKSHLLAALLRANEIPAGLCYQRLSITGEGAPFCLHGLNAIYLKDFGWYRVDPRGNKPGVDAQFDPPKEKLAFAIELTGEKDLPEIYFKPLSVVVDALQQHETWDELAKHLPDSK